MSNKLVYDLVADDSRYQQAITRAIDANNRYSRSTRQTSENTKKDFDLVSQSGEVLKSTMIGVGGAIAGAFAVSSIQSYISVTMEAMDQTGKFAGRIGISTDALQGLRYAAGQAGVGMRDLDTSLQRMTRRVSEVADGTGVAQSALEELGLSATELNKLSPDQQLRAIAEAMRGVTSENDRLRLSVKLFDQGGAGMVNLLAEGSEGLQAMEDRARRVGRVLDAELIANVQDANDAIDDFQSVIGSTAQEMVGQLAPAIKTTAEALTALVMDERTAAAAGMATYAMLGRLTGALMTRTAATIQSTIASQKATQATIEQARREEELAQKQIRAAMGAANARAASERLAAARKTLAAATNQATISTQAMNVASRALNGTMALMGGPVGIAMMAAGAMAYYVSSSNDAAEANHQLASSTDDLIAKLGDLSEAELRVSRDRAVDAIYQLERDLKDLEKEIEKTSPTITISAYTTGGEEMVTAYRAGAVELNELTLQQEKWNTRLQNTRDYLAEIDSRLNPDVAANDEIIPDGLSEEELKKQADRNERWMSQLRQRVMSQQELLDSNYRADRARVEKEIQDQEQKAEALRLIDQKYDADKQLLDDREQERRNRQIEHEKNLLLSIEQRGMTEQELLWSRYEQDVQRVELEIQNEQRKEQALRTLWENYARDKQELDDQVAENARNSVERMLDTITGSQDRANTIIQGFASGMSAALADAAMSGELSFNRMAEAIINDMLRMYIQAQIVGPMMQAFGFGGMSAGGAGAGTGTVVAGVNHTGGIAGVADAGQRAVNASVFAGAPRFHTGGIVGSEVPIIAQRGEGVFTAEQMKRLAPAGGQTELKVSLKIINEDGEAKEVSRVEQNQKDGTLEMKAFIRSVVNGDLNDGGPIDRTLRAQYSGLSRRGYG
ncbi:phage tail tape measure C-terminal domain-containing protein [Endozoicomonas lisbonensis]|uniref:phage tail tape measure C-terminal domain-containing protein n=1 Tax=Endozoicomonas lisbonensis TaxID=3120522 RepID=UPI00339A24D8